MSGEAVRRIAAVPGIREQLPNQEWCSELFRRLFFFPKKTFGYTSQVMKKTRGLRIEEGQTLPPSVVRFIILSTLSSTGPLLLTFSVVHGGATPGWSSSYQNRRPTSKGFPLASAPPGIGALHFCQRGQTPTKTNSFIIDDQVYA